ncbi:MAG: response regulator [Pseudomonadota bacterium]
MKPSILLVDDEEAIRLAFTRFLSRSGYGVRSAPSLAEAQEAMGSHRFDAILLDLSLPDGDGLAWVPELRKGWPHLAVIVITGVGGVAAAVEAMRSGADNFLTKPVNMKDLDIYLRKCLELGSLRRKQLTQERTKKRTRLFVGKSRAMEEVMDAASIAVSSDSAVLLQGETGTGKGRLARWIHDRGGVNTIRPSWR